MEIVTPSPEEPLEFTGERYTSATSGEIKHEHYHRYFFSLQFCRQKVVLDIASGEGYGSAILGMLARQVVGVDIAPDAVNHASRNYRSGRVSFTAGDCIAIPLSDASVDVVVSFETLEHVADQKKFFSEIKRVLRTDGMLVMSTPNVEVYKEVATKENPFHVKELDAAEFRGILSENFANYRLFGQRSVVGSAITPDSHHLTEEDRQQTFRAVDSRAYSVQQGIGPPTYFIAVASDATLPEIEHGLLDDRPFLINLYDLLQKRAIAILEFEEQLRGRDSELTEVRSRVNQILGELRSRNDELGQVRSRVNQILGELRSRDDELGQLRRQLRVAETIRNRLEQQLRERDSKLSEVRGQVSQLRTLVASIYGSGSWRVTQPLRFLRGIAAAFKDRSARLAGRLRLDRIFDHPKPSDLVDLRTPEGSVPVTPGDATQSSGAPAAGARTETELQVLERSGLFDEQFYCAASPAVANAKVCPLEDFFYVGAFEGRRPNPMFDPEYYLTTNPDVAKAGINPAVHYFLNGASEGRDPSADFDTSFYLEANPDVAASGINPLVHFLQCGFQEGRPPLPPERYERNLQKLQRSAAARHNQAKLAYRPLLSILMPTYNTKPIYLLAAVRSVMAQAYPNWELRIVDDGSSNAATLEALKRVVAWDEGIFVVQNPQNRGIASATNDALQAARGEYVAMLDHDDELTVDALYEVVLALNADRATDVVYTDQDYVSPKGEPSGHLFKPDWSPTLFRGVMYVGHLLTVRRSLALEVAGFDPAFDLVQDFEFMLRISERTRKIHHVPKALYHWRRIPESIAGGGKVDGGIEKLQAAAVQTHLGRLQLDGCARPNPRHPHRVLIEPAPSRHNVVFDLFVHGRTPSITGAAAVENALARTFHRATRIVVPLDWSGVEITGKPSVNFAADRADKGVSDADRLSKFLAESSAEFVLVMSADVAPESEGWIELLAVAAQESDVVGACSAVLSPEGLIEHAGLIVASDGSLRPAMRGLEPESDGYAGSLSCAREISAAWADVVLLRRSAIAALLPPKLTYVTADFLVADLILRATRSGLRAVCVPYVRARHLTRAEPDADHRVDALLQQDLWAGQNVGDPFYNPNFADSRADYT